MSTYFTLCIVLLACFTSDSEARKRKNRNKKQRQKQKLNSNIALFDDPAANSVPSLDDAHVCQIFGDSHITTFDKRRFSTWGGADCTYILALDCHFASWLVYITVVNSGEVGKSVSTVVIYRGRTAVVLGRGWHVQSMDREVYMVERRDHHLGGGVHAVLSNEQIHVTLDDYLGNRVGVSWDGWNTVTIATQTPDTCGLCGNNNGKLDDEFINVWFVGSDVIASASRFMSSWVVDNAPDHACFATDQNKTCVLEHQYKNRCGRVFDSPVFKRQCLSSDIDFYQLQCDVDLCYKMDLDTEYPTECQIGGALAALCTARGGDMSGWEEAVGCPGSCSIRTAVHSTGCPLSYNPWTQLRCPRV